jgi:PKD repeat protein
LAACVFYSTIFHKSSVGAGFVTSGISNTDALIIQTIASNTVLDSLSTWQDMGDIPSAAYTYTVNNNTVNFTNTSLNSTNFTWDFGDGNSSSTANPQHTYTNPGTYTISLTASTICNEFTTTDTITIIPTIIINLDNTDFNIYPNPTSGVVTLQFSSLQDEITIQLFNSIGQKLVHQNCSSVNTVTLDLTTYNLGIYQIVVIDKKGTISCTPLIKK